MRLLIVCLAAAACLAAPALEARTVYVNPDGSGDATTIAQGINLAGSGDTVLVACGTYYEYELYLMGGSGGGDLTLRSETGDPSCVTIDGQGLGQYMLGLEGGSARIEGITVTGGQAGPQSPYGGGLVGFSTMLDVSHCNFVGNQAPAQGAMGGAVFLMDCSARFEDCGFFENGGYLGGAMACLTPGEIELQGCEFRGNEGYAGGGVFAGSAPALTSGADGAAGRTPAWLRGRGALGPRLAVGWGGSRGWQDRTPAPRFPASLNRLAMTDCRLYENEASGGGGLACLEWDCTLTGCTLARNLASEFGGAGTYVGLGSSFVDHCTFAENRSVKGACVYLELATITMQNTIIALNGPAEGLGGVESYAEIACSDIWGNQGGDWVGIIGGQYGVSGNFCAPPIFCYMPNHRYFLAENSPCLNRGECGQVGAFGVGCPGRRVDPRDRPPSRLTRAPGTPEGVPSTWGVVKQVFE